MVHNINRFIEMLICNYQQFKRRKLVLGYHQGHLIFHRLSCVLLLQNMVDSCSHKSDRLNTNFYTMTDHTQIQLKLLRKGITFCWSQTHLSIFDRKCIKNLSISPTLPTQISLIKSSVNWKWSFGKTFLQQKYVISCISVQ